MSNLKLDFSILTEIERKKFIDSYLQEININELTQKDLETIANYLLYGKDTKGKNSVDRGDIEIETRYKTWAPKKVESLDGLLESPTFNENQISRNGVNYKTPKVVFSREDNAHIPELHGLWKQIDSIELTLNFYDIKTGKRVKDPRKELLKRFSQEEIINLKNKAEELSSFHCYKLRHLLVELRREQYTIRDSYVTEILPHSQHYRSLDMEDGAIFDFNVSVYPLGLSYRDDFFDKIFTLNLSPFVFSEEELWKITKLINNFMESRNSTEKHYINFTELEHIYNLILKMEDIEDVDNEIESTTSTLIKTFNFYVELANLDEVQKVILKLKKERWKNQEIADFVNAQFGRTYTSNYISTIFRHKICSKIAEAAQAHFDAITNIFFPENFKKCNSCGKILLKNNLNFVKKARATDGFSNRCKLCDKADRVSKKENKK